MILPKICTTHPKIGRSLCQCKNSRSPGPPVNSTIVAEVYGPDYDQQIAQKTETMLINTEDVVDVDWK